jgi:O-acetyl-ADP-ribose deacetylase (regulator of RNase III)
MIEIIDKNIFEHNAQCIIHQANCHCRMASGVAAQIRRFYPEAVAADNATTVGDANKLGTFTSATGKDGKIIYNLYGQYNFGNQIRQTHYEGFYRAMDAIHKDVVARNLTTASVPYNIGCGLAGGSWKIVSAIIDEIWHNSPVELTICRYAPENARDRGY